jgi:SAM-dependent methyltransferase
MWDQRYSEAGFAFGTEPNDFLRAQFSRIPKGSRVLCLAEGEGRNAVFLAQQGYVVTAVDSSAVGLTKAQKLAREKGVEIETVIADLAEFEIQPDSWGGIVAIFAHLPPVVRQTMHKQVINGLEQRGIYILEAYTERQLKMSGIGGPPPESRDKFISLTALHTELSGLHFLLAEELERHISEGKYHQGDSAVVQLVAIKK